MKQVILLLWTIGALWTGVKGQCPENWLIDEVWELNSFQALFPGCVNIPGDLEIAIDIETDLDSLSSIETIGGNLIIRDMPDLENIERLGNLTSIGGNLEISFTGLTDLTGLENLSSVGGYLDLHNNYLENVDALSNLTTVGDDLKISEGSLVSLEGLHNLQSIGGLLEISSTILQDLVGLENITEVPGYLNIWGNLELLTLTGLDNITSSQSIDITGNLLLTDMAALQNLSNTGSVDIWDNDALIDLHGLENLVSVLSIVIIENESLTSLAGIENISNISSTLQISGNPQLSMCEIESVCNAIANGVPTIVIQNNAPGCNTPVEVENACASASSQVSGIVYADLDCNNIFDGDDILLSGQMLRKETTNLPFAFTLADGSYSRFLSPSTTNVFIADPFPGFSVNPGSYSLSTGATGESYPGFDFQMCPDSLFHNLGVTLSEYTPPRPGFTNQYQICVENTGTYTEDATLTFDFSEAPGGNYVTITDPAGGVIAGPTVSWNLTNLPLFTPVCFTITEEMSSLTPLGTTLLPHALVEASAGTTETTLIDNTARITQIVVGSFDPNDKTVNQPEIEFEDIENGSRLEYLIRFQNTGTFPATFIEVLDTLESNLDITTFQMIAASHPYTLSFPADNILKWRFDDINLPDSTSNEPESHGFVNFSIRTVPGLSLTDVVNNTASIYFDFNEPVITNTATTSFFVGVKEVAAQYNLQLSAAPNPADDLATLLFSLPAASLCKITLSNTSGATLRSYDTWRPAGSQTIPLNLSDLAAGIYFVRVKTAGELGIVKIVVH